MFTSAHHRTHRKFSPQHILSQKDAPAVACNAFEILLELALLGRIEAATKLFNLVSEFAAENRSTWTPGMYFAWSASGVWPSTIKPEERTEESLHGLEVERVLWKRKTCCSEEGLEKLIKSACGRQNVRGETVIRGDDLKAAIDLACFMGREDKMYELLQVFADHFDTVWYRLARSRLVWKYLKDGALARAIGVDEDKLSAFETEVYDVFKERLEKGPRRMLKDLPMKELVELCNTNTLKNANWEEMEGVDPDNPPTTVLSPGASTPSIAKLESRLGLELAQDYKEFLSATNGMGPLWNGFHSEPGLLPAEKVFATNIAKERKKMYQARVGVGFFMKVDVDWEPPSNVIQINSGTEESRFVWLISPTDVKIAAQQFLGAVQQLSEEKRTRVLKILQSMHAGEEMGAQLKWIVVVWSPHTLELKIYSSFREYLEFVASETAEEDILEEEDEQGRLLHSQDIFTYQLRK